MLHGHKAFLFLLLKKFVFGFVILFLIANILFLLCYVLPDNPIYLLFPGYIPPDLIEEWETLLGLKRPMIEIYFDFIAGLFTCDFGVSFKFYPRGAILSLIGPYIGRTLFIFGYSVALSLILGGIVGKLISGRRNSISERILSGFAAFGFAFSSFLVATILIIITLSLTWDWPLAGFSSPSFLYPHNMDFNSKFIDILKHALLPLASVILPSSCGIYMLIRRGSFDWNRSRNIAPEDENHSFFSEVGSFFGAFIPVRPLLRLYMAFIMLSTIVIDIIFNYQGLGYLSLSSYMNDFPLTIASIWIQALILFFAIFVLELVLDIAIYVMPAREKSNYIVTIDE
ncbi:MAG: ABC transporter permease, partial [Thermoplasmata archaeon]